MRSVILVLALAACTPANRKGGMVIGGSLFVGGTGLAVADATIERPRNDSWVNFDDAILPLTIGIAAIGAAILVAAALTDEKPPVPHLPPPATAAR